MDRFFSFLYQIKDIKKTCLFPIMMYTVITSCRYLGASRDAAF